MFSYLKLKVINGVDMGAEVAHDYSISQGLC